MILNQIENEIKDESKYQIIHSGSELSQQLKSDIIEYHINSKIFGRDNASKYIQNRINSSYGNSWCVLIENKPTKSSHSFNYQEKFLFEFETQDQHILVYTVAVEKAQQFEYSRTNYQSSHKYPERFNELQTSYFASYDHVYRPYNAYYRLNR